ncbi:unnamed protein product [Zymoseptoria tritici ST99CH_3D7]|uniref:Uncharacterized protein n=1 Tax=Zymoseptoria tritici (strain ST99CH_3D7) TaxID=1276538 RepID=A0A1X7S4J0_ZYMT9|nr:unnamed protein product [Zymoseptoria tritici ST99CH_3D7]
MQSQDPREESGSSRRKTLPMERSKEASEYEFSGNFTTVEVAIAHINAGTRDDTVKEDDVEEVEADLIKWSHKLFDALGHAPASTNDKLKGDQQAFYKDGQDNAATAIHNQMRSKELCELVEARVVATVGAAIAVHRTGIPRRVCIERVSRRSGLAPELGITCSERLERMIKAVQDNKAIAKDVVDGDFEKLVHSPDSYLKQKIGNTKNNATKKRTLDAAIGKAKKLDAEGSGDIDSHGAAKKRRTVLSTNDVDPTNVLSSAPTSSGPSPLLYPSRTNSTCSGAQSYPDQNYMEASEQDAQSLMEARQGGVPSLGAASMASLPSADPRPSRSDMFAAGHHADLTQSSTGSYQYGSVHSPYVMGGVAAYDSNYQITHHLQTMPPKGSPFGRDQLDHSTDSWSIFTAPSRYNTETLSENTEYPTDNHLYQQPPPESKPKRRLPASLRMGVIHKFIQCLANEPSCGGTIFRRSKRPSEASLSLGSWLYRNDCYARQQPCRRGRQAGRSKLDGPSLLRQQGRISLIAEDMR